MTGAQRPRRVLSVVLLARSLNIGGAERQLVELATGLHRRGHGVVVAVFYGGGQLLSELRSAGVPVAVLEKRHRWDVVGFLWRLVRLLRRIRPDFVYAFLVVPSILAVLVKPLLRGTWVVWGVRASNVDYTLYDWLPRLTFRLSRLLVRFADLIIANSWAGADYHIAQGYPAKRIVVVPNGFDTERFRPDADAGRRMRAAWGIDDSVELVGIVGRLDPIKDYVTSLEAVALVRRQRPNLRLVSVGEGTTDYATELRAKAESLKITDAVLWAGPQDDMRSVYNALDVLCSSSLSEGFPNVLGEAMACGVPCVATDVGDSARILGDCGTVVRPGDPSGMAQGILDMLNLRTPDLQDACRRRIQEEYSIGQKVEQTERLLLLSPHVPA